MAPAVARARRLQIPVSYRDPRRVDGNPYERRPCRAAPGGQGIHPGFAKVGVRMAALQAIDPTITAK